MSQFPKFHGITLAGNSTIENLHVERLSADPSPVSAGRVWFNIVQKKIKFSSLDAEGNVVVSSFSSAAELTAALTEAKTYTDNAITTLKGVAPGVLDTLGEIAAALNNDPDLYNTLVGLMTEKVTAAKEELRGTVTAAFDTLGELESAVVRIDGDATTEGSFRKAIATASGLADSALQAEIARATQAEQNLHVVTDAISLAYQQGDSDLQAAISAEVAAREAAITAEVSARNSAITAAVAAEVTAREAADTTLQGNIDAEATARNAADTALQGKIGTLSSLNTTSKTDLVSAINEVRTLAGDGTDTLRASLNARVKRYVSQSAALTHTFNHGLNAEMVSVSVMVEGDDGKFRNDFVAIEETNSNTVTVGLTESRRIKLVVRNEADL